MKSLLALLLLTSTAFAKPPPGSDPNSPSHYYWECFQQRTAKLPCCRSSDGHYLSPDDWRQVKPNSVVRSDHYQVRVASKWYDVPWSAVIDPPQMQRCGKNPDAMKRSLAMVWYAPTWSMENAIVDIKLYCFRPGTLF